MKRLVKILALIFLLLVLAFFLVPRLVWWAGWAPDPIKESFDYPELGVKVYKPDTEDSIDWYSRSYDTDRIAGVFLSLRNPEKQATIDFVYDVAGPDQGAKMWLQRLRENNDYFSNIKLKDTIVCGVKAVEEISDYRYKDKKLKYYTVALKHKKYFIAIESSAPAQSFDELAVYCKELIGFIKLY